jgi:hypothetical protein
MVFGRRRTNPTGGTRAVPPADWLWSPVPTHPAIVTRALWDKAQAVSAEHSTSRDEFGIGAHPSARRAYPLRSRIRCRECRRRMTGITRPSSRYYRPGQPDPAYTYYICPHNPANPRHNAACPDHPRTVSIREERLMAVVSEFFAQRIFGPERRQLLAQALSGTPAQDAARRDAETAALRKRLRQIDASENAHARESSTSPTSTPTRQP